MEEKFEKEIRALMRDYNVFDKALEREFFDKYRAQLSDDEVAFQDILTDVEYIIKQNQKRKNRYAYPFLLSIICFFVAVAEFFIPLASTPNATLNIYGSEMLVVVLVTMALLIYTIISKKRRNVFNIVVIIIFLASWSITFFQICGYSFHWSVPQMYWGARQVFPCIIKIIVFYRDPSFTFDYINSEVQTIAFSPNFLISLTVLIIVAILYVKRKKIIDNKKQ